MKSDELLKSTKILEYLLDIIISGSPAVLEYCLLQIVAITAKMTNVHLHL